MTAKNVQEGLAAAAIKHGFAASVAAVLLAAQWAILQGAVEDNRQLAEDLKAITKQSAAALAESTAIGQQMIAQQRDIERVLERQTMAFERLADAMAPRP